MFHLYLLFLEGDHLAGEPLGVLRSLVVREVLLHVCDDLVLDLQTRRALFLQLPPPISQLRLLYIGFLLEKENQSVGWLERTGIVEGQFVAVYLCECGEGVLGLAQCAEASAEAALQGLVLSLLLTEKLFGAGDIHLRPVQLHLHHLKLVLLCDDGFLVGFNLSVQQGGLLLSSSETISSKRSAGNNE